MTSKAKAKSLSTDFTGVSKPFLVSKGSFTQKLTFLACFSIFLMIYFLKMPFKAIFLAQKVQTITFLLFSCFGTAPAAAVCCLSRRELNKRFLYRIFLKPLWIVPTDRTQWPILGNFVQKLKYTRL